MADSIERYIIISPVRDEAQHLPKAIESVCCQTIAPQQWIVVNDGSRDNSLDILRQHARPFMTIVDRQDRGFRKSGAGVIEAFNEGLSQVRSIDWDVLVKLDGDLSFAPDYFASCFERFRLDSRLGIAGGAVYHSIDGRLLLEKNPLFHVRGATKIYRRGCWEAIGGLRPLTGWDTIDEVMANMHGWSTRTFEDLVVTHHRYTGSADGAWKNLVKNGIANYASCYHPLFMAVKCLKRIFREPVLTGSAALMYGFCRGYLRRLPRVEEREYRTYIRRQQFNRLVGRESIWH
ncbi:MAG: glycosyltransferase family 2 protein [Chitinispirillaceae bacterium]|nr:glycosyltransferase family 2 protein [Chitinispirillaceae bacterium]